MLPWLHLISLCIKIFEGYGQTESTALVSLTNKLDLSPGTTYFRMNTSAVLHLKCNIVNVEKVNIKTLRPK